MKKNSIKINYIYNLFNQLFVIIVPIITTPYTSKILGASGVGTYSFTYATVTYFTLIAGLGTATYAQREIAFFRTNKKKISTTFFEVVKFRIITSLIAFVFYLFFLSMWSLYRNDNMTVMLAQGIYIIAVAFDITWFFQGLEEFKKIVFRSFLIKLLNLIFIFGMIRSQNDLLLYVVGLSCFTLLGNLSMWFYLPKYVIKVSKNDIKFYRNLKTIIALFVPTVAMQIYLVLDKTMIGIFTSGGYENGYYEQSEKIVKICITVITSLGAVMAPRVAYTYENSGIEHVKKYIYKSYRFVWFLGIPMCFGLISTADMIVPWFLGEEYMKCIMLIKILAFLIIAIGISNVTGTQYLIPIKEQTKYTFSIMCGALINFALNLILIPCLYSMGAAISSVAAETSITIIQIVCVVKGEERFSLKDILLPSIKYLISGGLMCFIVIILKDYFITNVINTIFLTVIGGIVYISGVLLLKDEFLISLIKKV